jgi:hypothetical protein
MEFNGFKTGKIKLPGILLDVELPPNTYFRNDGVREDFGQHYIDVQKELYFNQVNETVDQSAEKGLFISAYGKHLGTKIDHEGIETKFSVVFVRPDISIMNTQRLGHEATHAAIFLDDKTNNLKKTMLADLENNGFRLNPFEKYSNEEDVCDCFGMLGVYKLCGLVSLLGLKNKTVHYTEDNRILVLELEKVGNDLYNSWSKK